MWARDGRRATLACLLATGALGCASTVEIRPGAELVAPSVEVVVGLPISIGWGSALELRRLQRRASDSLMDATGGSAVIAEELLDGEDDSAVAATLRALGEDARQAVSLSLTIRIAGRLEPNVSAIPGFLVGAQAIVDYTARVEVRSVGRHEILGAVETVAGGAANEPEVDDDGSGRAVMRAIDEALTKAVQTFAPGLARRKRPFDVAEVPPEAAASFARRLSSLVELYPELSFEHMEELALSRASIVVVDPGAMVGMGVAPGDLLSLSPAGSGATRAVLARRLSRGLLPPVEVDRRGQHYMVARVDRGR